MFNGRPFLDGLCVGCWGKAETEREEGTRQTDGQLKPWCRGEEDEA